MRSFIYQERQFTWYEKLGFALIQMGPIPNHIGIILDGNRRFAKQSKLSNVIEGHKKGAERLEDVSQCIFNLGVKELTIYAFSIENFKRSKDEVAGLMELLAEKARVTEEKLKISTENGTRIEYLGNLKDSPTKSLKVLLEKNMLLSKNNLKFTINVAFIYTGRNEIVKGVNHVLKGLSEEKLQLHQVTENLLQQTFSLHPWSPVDILIRTSGELRLSDFLLWGASEAYLEFLPKTWPEFTFWDFWKIIFRYQNHVLYKKGFKNLSNALELTAESKKFVEDLKDEAWERMK